MTSEAPENYSEQLWEHVLKHRKNGFNVIPLRFKDKNPILKKWKEFQERKASMDELEEWFKGKEVNVAVLCGEISDNVFAIDFDNEECFQKCFDLKDIRKKTLVVKTGRGYHVYLKSEKPVSNDDLNQDVCIRSNGKYVVAPPSIHSSNVQYTNIGQEEVAFVKDPEGLINHVREQILGEEYAKKRTVEQKEGEMKWTPIKLGRHVPYCIKVISEGVGQGERHNCAFILARYHFNKNSGLITQSEIIKKLNKWNKTNVIPLPESELKNVSKTTCEHQYSWGCGQLKDGEYCRKECPYYKKKSTKETKEITTDNCNFKPIFVKETKKWRIESTIFKYEMIITPKGTYKSNYFSIEVYDPEGEAVIYDEVNKSIRLDNKTLLNKINDELSLEDYEKNELQKFMRNLAAQIPNIRKKVEKLFKESEYEEAPKFIQIAANSLIKNEEIFLRFDKELNRDIKKDMSLRRLMLLVGMSAYSEDPINAFIKGESGLGKTWNATKVMQYFPDEDVWYLGGVSPKALIHDYGDTKSDRPVIEMSGKTLLFLESPDPETFNILKPLLSHDKYEIEFKFTDTSTKPMRTKTVILRGFPASIFCTTDNKRLNELSTRSFTVTPIASEKKYASANDLAGEQATYCWNYRSETKKEIMKETIRTIKAKNQEITSVTLPFGKKLAKKYPHNSPRDMRDFKRLLSLIRNVAILHIHQRPIIEIINKKGETNKYLITFEKDYRIAVDIFNSIYTTTREGVSKQVIEFYEKVLKPSCKKTNPTVREIMAKYYQVYKKRIGRTTLKTKLLEPLEDIGWADSEKDPNNLSRNIYYTKDHRLSDNFNKSEVLTFLPKNIKKFFSVEDLREYLGEIDSEIVGEFSNIEKDFYMNEEEDNEEIIETNNEQDFQEDNDNETEEKEENSEETDSYKENQIKWIKENKKQT